MIRHDIPITAPTRENAHYGVTNESHFPFKRLDNLINSATSLSTVSGEVSKGRNVWLQTVVHSCAKLQHGGHFHKCLDGAARGKLDDSDPVKLGAHIVERVRVDRCPETGLSGILVVNPRVNFPEFCGHANDCKNGSAVTFTRLTVSALGDPEGSDNGPDGADGNKRLPVHCGRPAADWVKRCQTIGIDFHHPAITAQLQGGANG